MTPKSILCAVLLLGAVLLLPAQDAAQVQPPLAEGVASNQAELKRLLAKACSITVSANPPTPPSGGSETFSPYLTALENMRLHALLLDSQVTQALTVEQALMAAKQRQIEGPTSFQFHNLMALLNQRWPHDPATIAFFREALSTRGAAAIKDLAYPLSNAWDKSFTIPVVEFIERTGSYQDALPLLTYHHADWSPDATIPPRLSKVVMKAHPTLVHPVEGPALEGYPGHHALSSLGQTRDPAMVPVLRRFLKIKAIDREGLLGAEGTPLRVCDSAALALKMLLGYPLPNEDFTAGFIQRDKDYTKWKEWDQKIDALDKQLELAHLSAMLKQTNSMPWTRSMALGHLGGYPYRTNFPGVVTHDQPVTILTLRPLLKVKTVSDRASGRVLKRVCDLAFTDIKRLLGDPLVLEDRAFAGGAGHYAVPEEEWLAKWKEWDQKIDEMEKRLDILGYPSGDGTLGKYYVFPVK